MLRPCQDWQKTRGVAVKCGRAAHPRPRAQKSYSRKRQRQMNPLNAAKNVQNFYPCPKCEKGLVKLRHHLCPCDQSKINVASVMKVRGLRRARSAAGGVCCIFLTPRSTFLRFHTHERRQMQPPLEQQRTHLRPRASPG